MSAERVLKLSIALVLLLFFITPIGLMALRIFGADITTSMYDISSDKLNSPNGIISGHNSGSISEYKNKLRNLTAYRGEVKNAAELLEVVVVDFTSRYVRNLSSTRVSQR